MLQFIGFYRCKCGAITFVADDNREFSCLEKNLDKFIPEEELPKYCADGKPENLVHYTDVLACNHCVNHYGLDLCACGSGESPEECGCDDKVCGHPMQSLTEGYTSVTAEDAPDAFAPQHSISSRDLEAEDAHTKKGFSEQYQQAVKMTAELKSILASCLVALTVRIENAVLDGVEQKKGNLNAGTVKLSTMMASDSHIMSAEYYLPKSQGDLVRKTLSPAAERGDVITFRKKLNEMVESKRVELTSGGMKNTYPLNPKTVECLEEFLAANQ